ncbi:MAG: hypothetical protein K5872_20440 [Rhizobiaceae bacterium]|nr:hypothetical protein [Rhizobiaceae bacterium]
MTNRDGKVQGPPVLDFDLDDAERADIEGAIDAVCDELGLSGEWDLRRQRVASGVVASWRHGHRLPLNLVSGGLDAIKA